jgi:hypothetical protein
MKDQSKKGLYFLTINFVLKRHRDLIDWVKKSAEESEQSMSAFCISALKKLKDQEESDGKEEGGRD